MQDQPQGHTRRNGQPKVGYPSENLAFQAMRESHPDGKVYRCPVCDKWHVASRKESHG